jgi:hypothetical protein
LADQSAQLVLNALSKAVTRPAGLPLHAPRGTGLFGATAPARKAAQHCKEQNYLRVIGTEKQGKTDVEVCTITDRGLAYLISLVRPAKDWLGDVLTCLTEWQNTHPTQDCSLPQLYRTLQQTTAQLSIGQFHDGLRELHARGQIYLHPWTGPLQDIPEPAVALLVGHEVAYYASKKQG